MNLGVPSDGSSLDVDQAVRLCLRFRLFSAFTHVANRGLRDFALPVDVLLAAIATCEVTGSLLNEGGFGDKSQSEPVGFGYRDRSASEALPMGRALRPALVRKLLLYLAYCVSGRRFPRGSLLAPDASASAATSPDVFFAGVLAAETGSASLLPPLLPLGLRVGALLWVQPQHLELMLILPLCRLPSPPCLRWLATAR